MADPGESQSLYIVVIRAGSRLRFLPNERLEVHVQMGAHGASLTYQTRYSNEGYASPVPRELWIEGRGSADSLDAAIVSFTNAALFFTTIISSCANGDAGDCRFHLAYDATLGRAEREFFEQFVEDVRGLPRPSRKIKPALVQEVINAIGTHPESERLRRAIGQRNPYRTPIKG